MNPNSFNVDVDDCFLSRGGDRQGKVTEILRNKAGMVVVAIKWKESQNLCENVLCYTLDGVFNRVRLGLWMVCEPEFL